MEWAVSIPGVDGALAVLGDTIAALGQIEIVSLEDPEQPRESSVEAEERLLEEPGSGRHGEKR